MKPDFTPNLFIVKFVIAPVAGLPAPLRVLKSRRDMLAILILVLLAWRGIKMAVRNFLCHAGVPLAK
jgi:hypothetical protein